MTEADSIDLYKVCYHGSPNATPRSVHAPVDTALSRTTRADRSDVHQTGVHRHTEKAAVPRRTLFNSLKDVATLSTDDLPQQSPFLELITHATGGPFKPLNH